MLKRFFFLCISSVYLLAQTSGDQIAFQKAMSAPTDSLRLLAFDTFIADNPNSKLISNAYAAKFQLYSNQKNDSAAFEAIRKYLSLMDASQIVPALNAVAYEFAQRKFHLDSAVTFIDQAMMLYKKDEPVLLNTKAFVLYQMKRYDDASKIQQKVLSLLPPNSEYDSRYVSFLVQMGFIQLELNEFFPGMKRIILGNIVLPRQSISVATIDSLLESRGISVSNVSQVRDSLYTAVVSDYVGRSTDSLMVKSKIGVSLSRNNILPETALRFAIESYEFAQQRTVEERSGAAGALGLTYYHLKDYPNAEKFLSQSARVAIPNDFEIFFSLGETKEKLGKKEEAFDIYISGITSSRSSATYSKLMELKNDLFPSLSLDSIIIARQAALLQFIPEKYHRDIVDRTKNEYEKVVLAELFTGSECKPCQAVDIAFDYLNERFSTSSLAILEYHLHIPQPDPLSNTDAEKRAEYYGVNSTPTAVFDGNTVIKSGGPKIAAKSKFFLFSEVIEQKLTRQSVIPMSLSATLKKNTLTIKTEVLSTVQDNALRLRIAIVEDEISYKGANEIELHRFVVRKMLKSSEGYGFPKNGKLRISETVNMSLVTAELKKYYTETNDHYSELGSGLKSMEYDIDLKRLSVVAFVQDDATREILQARVFKIK